MSVSSDDAGDRRLLRPILFQWEELLTAALSLDAGLARSRRWPGDSQFDLVVVDECHRMTPVEVKLSRFIGNGKSVTAAAITHELLHAERQRKSFSQAREALAELGADLQLYRRVLRTSEEENGLACVTSLLILGAPSLAVLAGPRALSAAELADGEAHWTDVAYLRRSDLQAVVGSRPPLLQRGLPVESAPCGLIRRASPALPRAPQRGSVPAMEMDILAA